MRFTAVAFGLFSTCQLARAAFFMDKLELDTRWIHADNETKWASVDEEETFDPSEIQWTYLNEKTAKYKVEAYKLPAMQPRVQRAWGESYAGLLPNDHGDGEIYFWFFPSKNPEASKDEITIWLNGGPGCSSLDGLLHEHGPVLWQSGTYRPVANIFTWNNLTNIVYVEQPVGTGFSRGTVTAKNEVDVSNQFAGFWKNFVDLFDLQNRKVYITGESYAGQYVPYIADGMLNRTDKTYFNVNGIMVYDPSIGPDSVTEEATAVAFMNQHPYAFPFNDTFLADIRQSADECGYTEFLEKALTFPPPQEGLPSPPGTVAPGPLEPTVKKCRLFNQIFREALSVNPCFNIYMVYQGCPLLWDVLGFPYSTFHFPPGYKDPYFNHTEVKKIINAPLDSDWRICSKEPVFVAPGDTSLPSAYGNGPMQRVVEKTNNVVVGHGAVDMVLIANGSLITLNNMTWNGRRGFNEKPTKAFFVPYHDNGGKQNQAGAGVYGSWVSERGLTFVTVDASGHEVPEYQPAAAYRTLELLLGRIKDLSEISSFTTQPGYPQPKGPVGKGNGLPTLSGRGANIKMPL